MYRGVFWIIENKLCAYPFRENEYGGIAKSGNTYNHKKLWDEIKPKSCNKPFNYYPRGRVEINNRGKAVIYLNPLIDESYYESIKEVFEITEMPVIRADHSEHYKCYLDNGWKADW